MTEANYDRLRKSLEEALAHARGEVTGVRVAEVEIPTVDVRAKLGISQDKMAAFLGVSPSGLRKWEQGQRRPRGAALTLLRIADAEPEAVLRALRAA